VRVGVHHLYHGGIREGGVEMKGCATCERVSQKKPYINYRKKYGRNPEEKKYPTHQHTGHTPPSEHQTFQPPRPLTFSFFVVAKMPSLHLLQRDHPHDPSHLSSVLMTFYYRLFSSYHRLRTPQHDEVLLLLYLCCCRLPLFFFLLLSYYYIISPYVWE